MFGFKRRKADVLSHWFAIAYNFQLSSQDFYHEVEEEIKVQQVPGLEMSKVDFAEGGVLSDNRVYLRMYRERLVFDVCAAPFGINYFFSCRFAEIPAEVRLWQMALSFFGILLLFGFFVKVFGLLLGPFAFFLTLAMCFWMGRNAISLGLNDLDAMLIKTPVVGPLYERFVRKETYYRQDTRLMYLKIVSEIVKTKVEKVTAAKGVTLLRFHEYDPILGELYKPTEVHPVLKEPMA